MNVTGVDMVGFKELDDMLGRLPVAVAGALLTEAVHAGMSVIADEARRRVPVATGETRDAIAQKIAKRNATGITGAVGVFGGNAARKARLLEMGVGAHDITGRLLKGADGTIFGRKVRHPGFPAKPFLRPAADSKAAEAVRVLGQSLGRAIEEEARTGRVGQRVVRRQALAAIRSSKRARGVLPARKTRGR